IWLIENGCSWSSTTYEVAIENDQFEILKWLIENNSPSQDDIEYLIDITINDGNLKIFQWLYEKFLQNTDSSNLRNSIKSSFSFIFDIIVRYIIISEII